MQDENAAPLTTQPRREIADLYFWLGAEAEIVGFTPWQTAWVAPIESLPSLASPYQFVPATWERADAK